MFWIFFALGAALAYALVNVGDKYAVAHRFRNPFVFLAFTVYPHVLLLPFIFTVDFSTLGTRGLVGAILASGLYFYASLAYIKAMATEEVTRVNLWLNSIPLFSLFLAYLFLGESITGKELIAFIFFLAGTTIATLHARQGKSIVGSRALVPLIIACLAYGSVSIIYRYLGNYNNWDIFIIQALAMSVWAAFLPAVSKSFRKDCAREIKNLSPRLTIIVLVVVALDLCGTLLNIKALSLAPAPLVNAFIGVQSLLLFTICLILFRYRPALLGEQFDRRNLLLKLAALIFILIGVWVLYLA